jgi:hypothetical protein
MTRADIFIRIISEVSGKPEREINDILKAFRQGHPGGKWDDEIPDGETETLLNNLRAEAPGIFARLIKGADGVRP